MPVLRWALVDRALYPGFGGRWGAPACRQECLCGALTPPGSSLALSSALEAPTHLGATAPSLLCKLPVLAGKETWDLEGGATALGASSCVVSAGDATTGQLQMFTRQNDTATPLRTPGVKQGQNVSQL